MRVLVRLLSDPAISLSHSWKRLRACCADIRIIDTKSILFGTRMRYVTCLRNNEHCLLHIPNLSRLIQDFKWIQDRFMKRERRILPWKSINIQIKQKFQCIMKFWLANHFKYLFKLFIRPILTILTLFTSISIILIHVYIHFVFANIQNSLDTSILYDRTKWCVYKNYILYTQLYKHYWKQNFYLYHAIIIYHILFIDMFM